VQVFNHMTRCKRPQRRFDKFLIKDREKFFGILKKPSDLNMVDVEDTLYVKVKFVKI
jgi:hypothetical protein